MAKICLFTKSNRGKDITCSKCGKRIEAGVKYFKATPYKRSPIIRCTFCGLKSYETSGSEYVRQIGKLVEEWSTDYDIIDGTAEEIANELEDIKMECEDSLENIPEQLREGEAGSILQERIDELEECISALSYISFEDLKDDCKEEAEKNVGDVEDFDSEEEWEEQVAEELDHLAEETYQEAIDNALENLTY